MPNSTTGGENLTLKNDNKMQNYLFTLDLLQYFDIEDITLKKLPYMQILQISIDYRI